MLHIFPLFYNFMPRNLNSSTMKRLFQLIALLIFISVSTANAQERHYSYRYSGTTYKAKGGGETTMVNKLSTSPLKGEFIASILPDHKTVWLYSSAINARCTGKGVYQDGGYRYNSPLSNADVLTLVIGDQMPTGGYTIFIKSDNSRITCISTEEDGEYYSVRYDHYNRISAVAAPKNSKRSEFERKEAESKASSERLEKELAEERAQREREQKAFDAKLQSSIGSEFPMAHFIDSHGNRVDSSFFKRGKKTLVVTYMVGCTPNRELKKVLDGYPQLSSQIVNIYLSQTSYSKFKNNASAPVRTDRIYYNPNEGDNRNWIYGRSYPCIILLDERGYVLDYQFGFDKEDDMDYMMNIINQLRGRSSNGAPYQVGDYYKNGKTEGIVFEVWDNGYSGKIVSLKHSDKIRRWGSKTTNYSETFGVKDGKSMMAVVGAHNQYFESFGWCSSLGWQWYLPTIDELQTIYKNKAVIEPKLTDRLDRYWSCTEYNANEAYYIEKDSGVVWHSEKHYGCRIRAVATFGKSKPKNSAKTSAPYKVGDYYNENGKRGVVFEVSADGKSGKIVSLYDISAKSAWSINNRSGAIGAYSMTDGAENSATAIQVEDWKQKMPAFERCDYWGKGWYLPSVKELLAISENKALLNANLNDLLLHTYWSSTEEANPEEANALAINFINNEQICVPKSNIYYVRAVAAFGVASEAKPQRTTAPYKVGDYYYDGVREGVVFEIWDNGNSGKIASKQREIGSWHFDDVHTTSEFDGAANMSAAQQSKNYQHNAFNWCANLGEGWYLPSIRELVQIIELNYFDSEVEQFCYLSSSKDHNNNIGVFIKHYKAKEGSVRYIRGGCHYIRTVATFGPTPRPKTVLAREKTSAPYKVGDYYNDGQKDGIVFEVSAGGKHGKIVSMCQPLYRIVWSTNGIFYLSAKSKSDGVANMEKVKQQSGWRAEYPAFRWCDDLGEGWYLPAINEMNAIIKQSEVLNRGLIDKLDGSIYLSSTESKKRPEDCKASNVTSAIATTTGEDKGFVTYKNHCSYLGGYKVRAVAKF